MGAKTWSLAQRYRRTRDAGLDRAVRRTWRFARWDLRQRFGPSVAWKRPERLTAILLNWRRPHNIAPIVRSLLRCRFIDHVAVVNQNPAHRARDLVAQRDDRLTLRDEDVHRGPIHRYTVARELDADHFLALDDDLFLDPRQIAALFERLLDAPEVPHGVTGQRVDVHAPDARAAFTNGVGRLDGEVDILNRVYAFTRAHVRRVLQLRDDVPHPALNDGIPIGCDVFLSFSGEGRPRIHDLGRVLDCPSSEQEGVAVFKREGFSATRLRLYQDLSARVPR